MVIIKKIMMKTTVSNFAKFELSATIIAIAALIFLGILSSFSKVPIAFEIGLTILILIDLFNLAFQKKRIKL